MELGCGWIHYYDNHIENDNYHVMVKWKVNQNELINMGNIGSWNLNDLFNHNYYSKNILQGNRIVLLLDESGFTLPRSID